MGMMSTLDLQMKAYSENDREYAAPGGIRKSELYEDVMENLTNNGYTVKDADPVARYLIKKHGVSALLYSYTEKPNVKEV